MGSRTHTTPGSSQSKPALLEHTEIHLCALLPPPQSQPQLVLKLYLYSWVSLAQHSSFCHLTPGAGLYITFPILITLPFRMIFFSFKNNYFSIWKEEHGVYLMV